MLVVVALVVLMMLILASIFQAATGAMTTMRTLQELDDELRLLDRTIRIDLTGVTATMTPPNNPLYKTGFFEYGENAPSDLQGEDTDDYLAFTTKAPEGMVFTGRCWVGQNVGAAAGAQGGPPLFNRVVLPVTISSQYAEVIYFLRNGNLYRRVLLIVPERNGQLSTADTGFAGGPTLNQFGPDIFNGGVGNNSPVTTRVSFMAVNDISARPGTAASSPTIYNPSNGNLGTPTATPIPNDLGDLTNREHRFARPRLGVDYYDYRTLAYGSRDGIADDGNSDLIPDYYPTLTWTQVAIAASSAAGAPQGLMNEDQGSMPGAGGIGYARYAGTTPWDTYAFPYIFPGMYSKPETASLDGQLATPVGWLHALDTTTVNGVATANGSIFNHAPVEFGDSLPVPSAANQLQTWWGFPTWRETASIAWGDPIYSLTVPNSSTGSNALGQQVLGLQWRNPGVAPPLAAAGLLPPLGALPPLGTPAGPITPYGSEGAGYAPTTGPGLVPFVTAAGGSTAANLAAATPASLSQVWEDDLIMTGVRSFDVKAFDTNAPLYSIANKNLIYGADYYDLGYASTAYTGLGNNSLLVGTGTLNANNVAVLPNGNPIFDGNQNPLGFGHEGRMPPLPLDFRVDPQRPFLNAPGTTIPSIVNNIGDPSAGLMRMRRVWDSWSTDYTNAPAIDVNLRGSTLQPGPLDRPIYPSYPPPYPQPMRGIQIQIRVVDPKNEKVKVLTIRQDFSDKL
jgi:hypothetical protein